MKFLQSNAEPAFSKKQVVQWLLEDGVGAGENDDEDNMGELSSNYDWCNSLLSVSCWQIW